MGAPPPLTGFDVDELWRCRGIAYRYLRDLGGWRFPRADLDDLVQDALERVIRRPTLRLYSPPFALRWAARESWKAWHRKRRPGIGTDVRRVDLVDETLDERPDLEEQAMRRQLTGAVAEALAALPDGQREVLEAAAEGAPVRETASALGISLGTIDSRRQRALYRVRRDLRRGGFL